jgi:hypothetical protein
VIIKGMTPAIISKLPPGDPKILIMYSGIPAGKGSIPSKGPLIMLRLWVKRFSMKLSLFYVSEGARISSHPLEI